MECEQTAAAKGNAVTREKKFEQDKREPREPLIVQVPTLLSRVNDQLRQDPPDQSAEGATDSATCPPRPPSNS